MFNADLSLGDGDIKKRAYAGISSNGFNFFRYLRLLTFGEGLGQCVFLRDILEWEEL